MVRIAYRAMLAGKPMVIPGWYNKVFALLARHLPIWFIMWMVGKRNAAKKTETA